MAEQTQLSPQSTAPLRAEDDLEFVQLGQNCNMLTCNPGANLHRKTALQQPYLIFVAKAGVRVNFLRSVNFSILDAKQLALYFVVI